MTKKKKDSQQKPAVKKPPRKESNIIERLRILHNEFKRGSNELKTFVGHFRKFVFYAMFLAIVTVVALGPREGRPGYFFHRYIEKKFIEEDWYDATNDVRKTFRDVGSADEVYEWMEYVTLPALYDSHGFHPDAAWVDTHIMVGMMRMRQLRVPQDVDCPQVKDTWLKEGTYTSCFSKYSIEHEYTANYYDQQGKPNYFNDEVDLGGARTWVQLTTYSGGGYIEDFSLSRPEDLLKLDYMKNVSWIGESTRSVSIEFTLWNPQTGLYAINSMWFEFASSGAVVPSYTCDIIRLNEGEGLTPAVNATVNTCEGLLYFCLLVLFLDQILRIIKLKAKYIQNSWNLVDFLICVSFAVSIGTKIARDVLLGNMNASPSLTEFTNFRKVGLLSIGYRNFMAVVMFFCYFKLFKYLDLAPKFQSLISTLQMGFSAICYFFVCIAIILLGYALAGVIVFGNSLKDYRSFSWAFLALVRGAVGDMEFYEIMEVNRVFGPLFYITFFLLVFYVLVNIFIAIINNSYDAAVSNDSYGAAQQRFENILASISDFWTRSGVRAYMKRMKDDRVGGMYKNEIKRQFYDLGLDKHEAQRQTEILFETYGAKEDDFSRSQVQAELSFRAEKLLAKPKKEEKSFNDEIVDLLEEVDIHHDKTMTDKQVVSSLLLTSLKMDEIIDKTIKDIDNYKTHKDQASSKKQTTRIGRGDFRF